MDDSLHCLLSSSKSRFVSSLRCAIGWPDLSIPADGSIGQLWSLIMASLHELRSNYASTEGSFVHIDAWADEAVQAITTLKLRTPTPDAMPSIRGTHMKLEIPLDARPSDEQAGDAQRSTYLPRRPLSRRDSMKRRDALLRGKEGSRRRQRWENSQLMCNTRYQDT